MSWKENRQILWAAAQDRHQGALKIRPKSEWAWAWKTLRWLLNALNWIVSLGKRQGIDLYDGSYTTGFKTLWVPSDGASWESLPEHEKYNVLSHEIDHFDQGFFGDHTLQDKPEWDYSRKPSALRMIWHGVKYLLSFSYRRQVEAWGYERNMRVEIILNKGSVPGTFKQWMRSHFVGSKYFYMANEAQFEALYADMLNRTTRAYTYGHLNHMKPE
ncbi:MAG: hypothetical protein KDB07_01845 [Planctomycetes bacterium]|nr:hypothetical protein [Planctomycetota bacterium]